MKRKNPNAFSQIKSNLIILDFSSCKYIDEIHLILKKNLVYLITTEKIGMLYGIVLMDYFINEETMK